MNAAGGLLLFPALFLVENVLGGPLGQYRGFPLRLVLFGVMCGALALAVLVRGKITRAHLGPVLAVVGFLLFNAVWAVIVPAATGVRAAYAMQEARAFLVLVPVALLLAVVPAGALGDLVRRFQRLAIAAAVVLALFQGALWIIGTLLGEWGWAIPIVLEALYEGAEGFLYVGPMPDGFFRVLWISSLWCLVSLFWVPVAIANRRLAILCSAILLFGLFVTYSRGIWLALVVGAGVTFLATTTRVALVRKLALSLAAVVVIGGALFGVLAATGQLERAGKRVASTTSTEDPSIDQRMEQVPVLLDLWYEHPMLGNGYGAYNPQLIRSQDAPFSYEHMPLAFLAKLGVIGLLGLFGFGFHWATTAWRERRRARQAVALFLGAGSSFVFATVTNPMIINFVGMSIVGCLLLQWAALVAPGRPAER